MDTKQFETNTWYFALVLLVSSMFLAVLLLHGESELQFGISPIYFVYISLLFIVPTLLALALGVVLAGNNMHQLKLWVEEPTFTISRNISDLEQWMQKIDRRLQSLNFQCHSSLAKNLWEFSKEKASSVQSFEDHAFKGTIAFDQNVHPATTKLTLIMLDTLIVETGEFRKLEALANYLIGNKADYHIKTLPFTLFMALAHCVISQISAYWSYFGTIPLNISFWGSGFFGVGLGVVMITTIQQRSELIGRRVAVLIVLSTMIPIFSVLVKTLGNQ